MAWLTRGSEKIGWDIMCIMISPNGCSLKICKVIAVDLPRKKQKVNEYIYSYWKSLFFPTKTNMIIANKLPNSNNSYYFHKLHFFWDGEKYCVMIKIRVLKKIVSTLFQT